MPPRVSVFMPTFRRARSGLTERALESVRTQAYTDWELFVLDDGSTDGTEQLVRRYAELDDRIRVQRMERNTGLPAKLINDAMLQAQGEYFAFMFDDDFWYGDALQVLVEGLDSDPAQAMVYGNVLFPYRDPAGVVHRDRVLGSEPQAFDCSALEQGNYIANVAVIVRRVILEQVGTFDPHILVRRLCDWDLWLRIGKAAGVGHLDRLIGEASGLLTDDSLGNTVSMDFELVRRYMSLNRNAMLTPEAVRSYGIDDLALFGDHLTDSEQVAAADTFAEFYRQTGQHELAHHWEECRAAILEAPANAREGVSLD